MTHEIYLNKNDEKVNRDIDDIMTLTMEYCRDREDQMIKWFSEDTVIMYDHDVSVKHAGAWYRAMYYIDAISNKVLHVKYNKSYDENSMLKPSKEIHYDEYTGKVSYYVEYNDSGELLFKEFYEYYDNGILKSIARNNNTGIHRTWFDPYENITKYVSWGAHVLFMEFDSGGNIKNSFMYVDINKYSTQKQISLPTIKKGK